MIKLDNIDYRIIDVLEHNSRLSINKIAKKINIPITTVYNRLKRLEKLGIIKRYTIDLDYNKIGRSLLAYILVFFDITVMGDKISRAELGSMLSKIQGVENVGYITGRYDIILTVRVRNTEELNELILDKLRKIPGIGRTETISVMQEIK